MTCSLCGRALPEAFPGATVACSCGAIVDVPRSSAAPPSSRNSGPYRGACDASYVPPERETKCPYCSNTIVGLVRICPHCDVRLENVRCARCFSLQAPGSFSCGRCGEAMELEPLLDATDAPCPRCRTPLEVASHTGDARTHECPRCGGIFVARDELADVLCRAELGGPLADPPPRSIARVLEDVRYLPCPLCHSSMNRANFSKVSGVIVDVCHRHGTWFDAGELTCVIAFAANGGLARARERDHVEANNGAARIELWRDFLNEALRW